MKKTTPALFMVVAGMFLVGCAYDTGYYAADYGPSGDYGPMGEVYYDGYYGPYRGGYWGRDGYFYFSNGGSRYFRDRGTHFRRGGAQGYRRYDGGRNYRGPG